MRVPPTLLLLTGPPGTGKSALAERVAVELGAPVLGRDWVMAGLTGFDTIQAALRDLPAVEHRRVGWSIMRILAIAQLRAGYSVVLDGVARDVEVAGTRALARAADARCVVVVTSCSDRACIAGASMGDRGGHPRLARAGLGPRGRGARALATARRRGPPPRRRRTAGNEYRTAAGATRRRPVESDSALPPRPASTTDTRSSPTDTDRWIQAKTG